MCIFNNMFMCDDDFEKKDIEIPVEEIYKIYLTIYGVIVALRFIILELIKDEQVKNLDLYKYLYKIIGERGKKVVDN